MRYKHKCHGDDTANKIQKARDESMKLTETAHTISIYALHVFLFFLIYEQSWL